MLWPREEFHAAYGQIKHDGIKSGGCSVLVLVAMDVDALCACEILTSLFKADFLSYSLLAVRGYDDILRIREARIRDEQGNVKQSELRSVVMINCGAIVNVMELLVLPAHMKCYIFDSHRPIHLANIYDPSQQIVVFDDGSQALDEYPADGSDIENDDFEVSDEEEEEEEEDDDEDGEDGDDDDADDDEDEAEVDFSAAKAQDTDANEEEETPVSPSMSPQAGDKRKREDSSAEDIPVDDDEELPVSSKKLKDADSDDDQDNPVPRADASAQQASVEQPQGSNEEEDDASKQQTKRKRREEILRYYRGSYNGAPAATIAFELAQQMNSSQRDLLWFAIIGLTKQFVMEEIDADNYNLMIHRFQDEVLALDATLSSTASNAVEGDTAAVLNPAYDHGKISFEEEFRFMCYRHWSLYDAMYYSDYVASKLGLYMDQARRFGARSAASHDASDGETSLHVFLARMGFSLRQSQQKFTYMPLEMKQMLREKTQEIAPEFDLDELFYGSFKRQFAFQYQLCAADAVRGLQALLEAPESYISSVFQAETHQQQQNNTFASMFTIDTNGIAFASNKDASENSDEENDVNSDFRQQNFMLAHTAVSCKSVASSKLMESGIKVAMELKQAIVRVGISIMERKLIVRVKHFRYVCLNVPEREQELFAHANVLTQLALFLLNVHRASGKWGGAAKKPQVKKSETGENDEGEEENEDELTAAAASAAKSIVPLVLITRNPAQNCFLVVGITCPTNPGEIHRNTLGTAFKLAAGETGANFRQDGFTSAVMEIQMDEIQYFVEQLHNVSDTLDI
uniref:CDC45-like protein n=1 Tax=Globisporangium ultimum (strain ATCC 200006 / CBS 805.95 / DAOM BR144) TaxID=431595 RepID=K3X452_GLOUD